MTRQSFCILQFFSGKFEVGGCGVCSCCCYVWGSLFCFFLWEIPNISNQLKLQVLPGNFIDSEPIRNSLVSFYIYLGMSMPAHHHQKNKIIIKKKSGGFSLVGVTLKRNNASKGTL